MIRRFGPVALLVTALALAGCASTSVAVPDPISSETPAPTPSPTASAEPQSTVPLECADLFTDAEASALAGTPVVAVESAMLLNNLGSIAARQAGMLHCAWNPADETSIYFGYAVSAEVIDKASDEFAARDPFDDGDCWVQSTNSGCVSQMLVEGYWAQISSRSRTIGSDSGLTIESLSATWAGVKDSITAEIVAAGAPLDAWAAPSGSFTGAYCDTRPGFTEQPGQHLTVSAAAAGRVGGAGCVPDDDWRVSIVDGGAWALPIMAQALPPADKEVGNWTPFDVPGADVALRACGEYCIALISIGGSAVSVSSGTFMDLVPMPADAIPFDDAARALLAEVIAAG